MNVLRLKSYEIQIDVLKLPWLHFLASINGLFLVCRPLGGEMSQGLYITLQTFQSISLPFVVVFSRF